MDGKTIAKLFEVCGLEKPAAPAAPVSGGFMHRMYKVDTAAGSYAVKHLNLEVMKRPEAMPRPALTSSPKDAPGRVTWMMRSSLPQISESNSAVPSDEPASAQMISMFFSV